MKTCGTCRYWQGRRHLHYTAECKRHAPVNLDPKDCNRAVWPQTSKDDKACGDYET